MIEIKQIDQARLQDLAVLYKRFIDEEDHLDYPVMDEAEFNRMAFITLQHVSNPICVFLVAYDDEQPVGFMIGEVIERQFGKPRVFGSVRDIYVLPEWRNSSAALRMICKVRRIFRNFSIEHIEVVTRPESTAELRWWRLGFKPYLTHSWIKI